jgi:UbiD family decarboxylase
LAALTNSIQTLLRGVLMFQDLREFLDKARELDEVTSIDQADWDLEIGAVTEIAAYEYPQSSVLVFDDIPGYPHGHRVVTNFVNTERIISVVSGFAPDLKSMDLVRAFRDKLQQGFKPIPPAYQNNGPVLENTDSGDGVDLFKFPVPKWHKMDGGRYIGTGNLVVTQDPDNGWVNLGCYRVQALDKNTAAIFTAPGRHGDIIRRKYWDKGKSCPTAVVCGSEPLLFCVAGSSVPQGMGEYDYTGWLGNSAVKVLKGPSTGLPIPATSEIVLEGDWVPPSVETRSEGPFGEFTGYYASGARDEAVLRVKSVSYRNNPILLGAPPLVGRSSGFQRYFYSGLMWMELEQRLPGIKGVWIYTEGGGRSITVISLKQQFAGHAKQALMIASAYATAEPWRFIIAVDDDIDPSNISEVLWAVGSRCDPGLSIDILRGCRGTPLDTMLTPESRRTRNYVHNRGLVDACRPYHWIKEFPPTIKSSPEEMAVTREKWGRRLSAERAALATMVSIPAGLRSPVRWTVVRCMAS